MSYFDQLAPILASQSFNPANYNPWNGVSLLPKAQSNFGGRPAPIGYNPGPVNMLNALTNAQSVGGENQLRQAQVQQLQNQIAFQRQLLNSAATPMPSLASPGVNASDTSADVGSPAPGADVGSGAGGGNAMSSNTADTSIPVVGRALLDSISGPESGGAYNVRWGGPNGDKTFSDYSAHPNIAEPGPDGPSTAAGRYQIVNSTWQPLVKKFGFTDFSPKTQDQGAWHLAQDTYHVNTGRDLQQDLENGRTQDVAPALSGQWGTIGTAMGSYAANLAKYSQTADAGTTATDASAGLPQPMPSGSPTGQTPISQSAWSAMGGTGTPPVQPAAASPAVPNGGYFSGMPPVRLSAPMPQPTAPASQPQPRTVSGPPANANGAPAVNPQAIQWAINQDRVYRAMGLTPPAIVSNLLTFAPGGSNDLNLLLKKQLMAKGIDLGYAGPIAGAEARAKAPYTAVRPSGSFPQYDARGNVAGWVQAPAAPAVEPGAGVVVNPNTATSTPIGGGYAAGVGNVAQAKSAGEAQGKANVDYGNLLNPNLTAPPMTPQAMPSSPGPAGITSAPTATAGQPAAPPRPVFNTGVIPPITAQSMPGSPKELEPYVTKIWPETVDGWTNAVEPARSAEQRLMTMADAFKAVQTGTWTTEKADINARLKSLGLGPIFSNDPAEVEKALHENILTTLPLLKAATPRPSQIEFMSVSENREHPNLQPAANLRMLSEDIAMVRQAQQLPLAWSLAKAQNPNWHNPQDFANAWYASNPIGPAVDAVKQQIGPFAGMGKPMDAATAASANDAIARGAKRAAVVQRLIDNGYDTSGLK